MKVLGIVGAALAAILIIAAVFGIVTTWAWNETMPAIFGLPTITWLQGFALNLLGGALFKSTSISSRRD